MAFQHKPQTSIAPNAGELQRQMEAPLDREHSFEGGSAPPRNCRQILSH